jgi:hypothetical protein
MEEQLEGVDKPLAVAMRNGAETSQTRTLAFVLTDPFCFQASG